MALDELKKSDNEYDIDGFKYVVDKDFMETVKKLKIEYLDTGFKVTSGMDFGAPCSSCSTAGSCCS